MEERGEEVKGGKGERERESSFMYMYIGVSILYISKPWFSIQGTMSYTRGGSRNEETGGHTVACSRRVEGSARSAQFRGVWAQENFET